MQLEEYLEKDIINFLEQRMTKKKDLSYVREDDYGLYLTKDYIKEVEKLLDKDEITESEKLFDELKEHYNSLPKESLEARKIYSMLEIMYSKIHNYLRLKGNDKGVRALREILASRQSFAEVAFSTGPIQSTGNIERKLENIDTKISRFSEDVHQLKDNLITKHLAEIEERKKTELEKVSRSSGEEMQDGRTPTNNVFIPAANVMDTPVFEPKPVPPKPVPPKPITPKLVPIPRPIIEPKPIPPKPVLPKPVPKPFIAPKPSVIPVIISKTLVAPKPLPPVGAPVQKPLPEIIKEEYPPVQDTSQDEMSIMPRSGRKSKMILIPRTSNTYVPEKIIPEKKNPEIIIPETKKSESTKTSKNEKMTPQAVRDESVISVQTNKPIFFVPDVTDKLEVDHGTTGFDSGMMHNKPRISRDPNAGHGSVNPMVPMKEVNTSNTHESLYTDGLKLMYEGRYAEASRAFSQLLEKDPKNKKAAIRLQQCLGGK